MSDGHRIGDSVDHYRIVSKLGKGGMGEVFLAEDTKLERRVALKILLAEIANEETRVRRFVQEAKAASALNHPNILTVHEIGSFEGSQFIVTEYIKGETLRDRLSVAPLTLRETLDVTMQIAAALSAAHNAGLVHRDIKPENIMLRDDGFVKVLDFGLVKLTEKKKNVVDSNDATRVKTDPGMVMGTASYMSPEQARAKETDARTDIWSLGVVLYEMLTGETPFAGETANDSIAAILTKEPAALSHEIPHDLHRFVRRALQKNPDDRYQTIKDFLFDIQDLKRDLEVSEEIERSQIPPMSKSTNVGITSSGEKVTAIHSGAISTQNSLTHRPSSAEYIVSEIRQHKHGSLAVLGILLVALLGAGAYWWYGGPDASASISSVAVLPFVNAGGDPNAEYLSDGITEELINSLSQLKELKVIARSSAFKFKGKDVDLDEVARALGVQALVTGRVVQRGDQLEISAELVNVSDKSQLWGETFNRPAADATAVRAEISKQIAERLKQRLTSSEVQQLTKGSKVNPEAHDLLLRGRFIVNKWKTKDDLQKAINYFEQAIALDPGFAVAHADLARCYYLLMANSFLDPKLGRPRAEAAVKRALELDDGLAEAHFALSNLHVIDWNWIAAETELKRAIELNPNLASAHSSYRLYLSTFLRHDQSLVEARRTKELDPSGNRPEANIGNCLYFARRYNEAIEHLKKTLELDPEFAYTHTILGYAYAANGQNDLAVREYNESIRLLGRDRSVLCFLAAALARAGRRNEAEAIRRELETTTDYVSPAELAIVYVGLNETEKAFASLERGFSERDPQMKYLASDPSYDLLRSDLRFSDLLRRVGLPL